MTTPVIRPWAALWSLIIGFFMLLLDSTIVSIANPAIMRGLDANINTVLWATSGYLLAFVVPLLITGRLGDRFGPRRIYLVGLVVFTAASLWCGLSGGIAELIIARVLQGFGAALMSPQTMAIITRIFPRETRGAAMGAWGATAGIATLAGPLLGGLLVDSVGWEWIFFINVPLGVLGFILTMRFVPKLPTNDHRFDILGVVLSGLGMFLLVFGIQEGETYNWGQIWGPVSVPALIIAGLVVLGLFIWWQAKNKNEPLLPLDLFKVRDFSVANISVTTLGFSIASFALPLIFFLQTAEGLTPTQSALIMAPMAVISGVLAPFVGKLVDRVGPKWIAATGLAGFGVGLLLYSIMLPMGLPVLFLLIPSAIMGIANSATFAPLSNAAMYDLPPQAAGAGSGFYNAARQIGSVLGAAAIAALIQSRLAAEVPGLGQGPLSPEQVEGYAHAMSQTILLPAIVVILGAVVALFFSGRRKATAQQAPAGH